MRLVCIFANKTSPPVRRFFGSANACICEPKRSAGRFHFRWWKEMNIKTVSITNNQAVHPHPPLRGPPSPALGKAYAKRNSSIIYRHGKQFALTSGTSKAPSPTVVGEADLSRRESLWEFNCFSSRESLSPTFDSKRGIHKGENVEGRKNAARLLFCERNLSPCAAFLWFSKCLHLRA